MCEGCISWMRLCCSKLTHYLNLVSPLFDLLDKLLHKGSSTHCSTKVMSSSVAIPVPWKISLVTFAYSGLVMMCMGLGIIWQIGIEWTLQPACPNILWVFPDLIQQLNRQCTTPAWQRLPACISVVMFQYHELPLLEGQLEWYPFLTTYIDHPQTGVSHCNGC